MYIISADGHAVIVDPSRDGEASELVRTLGYDIDAIFLTHEHCDHISGADRMRGEFNAPVLCSTACAVNLMDPRINFSHFYNAFSQIQTKLNVDGEQQDMTEFTLTADRVFEDELTMDFYDHELYFRSTPGHTAGSAMLLVDSESLFSGDTLLSDDKTVTRFPTGSKTDFMEKTVPYLTRLDENIDVYPGHGHRFKLGERLKNQLI